MQTSQLLTLPIALGLASCLGLGAGDSTAKPGAQRGGAAKKNGIQPYAKVVTDDLEHQEGLFRVHRDEERVLYEIPAPALGKDLLWVTQLAATQAGFGYGGTGLGDRVVRWELRGEDVLLRDVKYTIRGEGGSIGEAVAATSLAPIIEVFPVKAWGENEAPVIDVTALFVEDRPEFSAKQRLEAKKVDAKRTFVESVKSFPTNIETEVLMTYELAEVSRSARRSSRRDSSQGAVTVRLHHSMVALPEEPAAPRVHDERVGFFSVSFEEYASEEHEVEKVRYITRWRLEKQDPAAEVSDPIEPIVFYVGRGVPERWRPYVHRGIEMWQPAFEKAGFSNAILAKDPPSPEEDPDWDAEDARYSVIRWLPSTIENAMGPHVNDPRTGEILEADILMYHNVLKLVRDWYFVQASPSDPRAQKLPMPDEVVGEGLAYVVAHEVGHSLGFPHNMKASSSFSVDQLRDPEFTAKYGTEASIMDYGRFNYVAQPGDGATLIPKVSIYDEFAVDWGYRQYADEESEQAGMAALVAKQVEDPMLRFGNPNPREDPTQQTEDLGAETILATALGLANVDRVAGYLVEACCRPGEDYELLENMYGELLGQRNRELGHVANLVGGSVQANLWYGDADRRFATVDAEEQRRAMAFLAEHAFRTPQALLDADILRRLEADGAAARILFGHERLLATLVSQDRVDRMAENAELAPEGAYLPVDMLTDLSEAVWSELSAETEPIDLYRRNLQRAHVERLGTQLAEDVDNDSDLPALARGQLGDLLATILDAQGEAWDETSRLHLEDMAARIREHLNPLLERAPTAGTLPAGATRELQR